MYKYAASFNHTIGQLKTYYIDNEWTAEDYDWGEMLDTDFRRHYSAKFNRLFASEVYLPFVFMKVVK